MKALRACCLASGQVAVATARFASIGTALTLVVPAVATIAAITWTLFDGIRWIDVALLVVMYTATMLGITLGFHRLFTHRSFRCHGGVAAVLAVLGTMAYQGPLTFWVASHRVHHQHSDRVGDPHSPRVGHIASESRSVFSLFTWAHIGWMTRIGAINYRRYAADILRNRVAMWTARHYWTIAMLGLVLPGVIAGCYEPTTESFLKGMLWGGLVRVFLVHNASWSINSMCHLVGKRPFETNDNSRNNALCAVITFGEGWHNNHHAFPASARHGLARSQFDLTYLVLVGLKYFGLAENIVLPSDSQAQNR